MTGCDIAGCDIAGCDITGQDITSRDITDSGVVAQALPGVGEVVGLAGRILRLGAGRAHRLGRLELHRLSRCLGARGRRVKALVLRGPDRLGGVVARRVGGLQRCPQEVHAQLGETQPAVGVDAAVVGRERPVRDSPPAQVVQGLRRLQPDQERLRWAERHPCGDQAVQPHGGCGRDEVGHGCDLPVQQRQDMEVPEPAQLLEPRLGARGIGHGFVIQERDLDLFVGLGVPRPVGAPQPALGQVVAEAVAAGDGRRFPDGGIGVALEGLQRLLVDALEGVLGVRLDVVLDHEDRDYRRGWRADRL